MRAAMHHARPPAGTPVDLSRPAQQPLRGAGDGATWHTKALRVWLLALLRLAVTGDRADRLEVMASARALDSLGTPSPDMPTQQSPTFHFFHATSQELCRALADPMYPQRDDILRRHIVRIDDRRLKRAFAATIETDRPASQPVITTGLPTRNARPR